MEVQWICSMMGMAEKVSNEESGRQARWRRCRTTGMDTAAEDTQDGNRRDVRRRRWRNGLEEWRQTAKILTGNDYQPEGVSLI